jgi:hypothetical protein
MNLHHAEIARTPTTNVRFYEGRKAMDQTFFSKAISQPRESLQIWSENTDPAFTITPEERKRDSQVLQSHSGDVQAVYIHRVYVHNFQVGTANFEMSHSITTLNGQTLEARE